MKTFGIISEGITDQRVLDNILCGYFKDMDLTEYIRFIQPFRDNTDKEQVAGYGGWLNVFEFCSSRRFLEAFEQNDYLLIQIDTDRSEDANYDIKKRNDEGILYTPEELINKVIEKFRNLFQTNFTEQYPSIEDRIIYAICVNEIECWLLPIFYTNSLAEATNNCIFRLNEKLNEKFGFYIDPNNKTNSEDKYYKVSKHYLKNKNLLASFKKNISLKVFIESLDSIKIVL